MAIRHDEDRVLASGELLELVADTVAVPTSHYLGTVFSHYSEALGDTQLVHFQIVDTPARGPWVIQRIARTRDELRRFDIPNEVTLYWSNTHLRALVNTTRNQYRGNPAFQAAQRRQGKSRVVSGKFQAQFTD